MEDLDDLEDREDVEESGVDYFIARQPILDRKQRCYAYEILFRSSLENYFSHNDQRRRTNPCLFNVRHNIVECAGNDLLVRSGTPLDERHGSIGTSSMGDKIIDNVPEILHSHEEHERSDARCDPVPIYSRAFLRRVFMTGHKGDAGRIVPVRERNARIGGNRRCRRHSRNDLKGNIIIDEHLGLLTSPPEDERVPAFQAGDSVPFSRLLDDQTADLRLGKRMGTTLLSDIDKFCIRPTLVEQAVIGQVIVDDYVCLLNTLQSFHRDETRITGTGADEINFSALLCHTVLLNLIVVRHVRMVNLLGILEQIIAAEIRTVTVHFPEDLISALGQESLCERNTEPVRICGGTL